MKFIVSSSTLAKQLQHLSGVLASGSGTIPILDNFFFEINKDTLTVTLNRKKKVRLQYRVKF
jgi:DNA polymerase-3 subunit beta